MPPLRAGVSHGESQMIQVSAALIATLCAETGLLKGRLGQPLDRSQSRGAQDDSDELDRTLEDQDERRRVDERSTEGEFARKNGHGEKRLLASTNEEDGWTLTEEHEDVQDDVASRVANGMKTLPCWPWTPTTLRQTTRW